MSVETARLAATPLTRAVLREVAQGLDALVNDPACRRAIDLRSLPLSEAERAQLRARLGDGEVEARCDVAGASSVRETSYAGVWWITHYDGAGRPVVERIEVASVPPLLRAHRADVARARERLTRELAPSAGAENDGFAEG